VPFAGWPTAYPKAKAAPAAVRLVAATNSGFLVSTLLRALAGRPFLPWSIV